MEDGYTESKFKQKTLLQIRVLLSPAQLGSSDNSTTLVLAYVSICQCFYNGLCQKTVLIANITRIIFFKQSQNCIKLEPFGGPKGCRCGCKGGSCKIHVYTILEQF